MKASTGHVLVVDDNVFNRKLLTRALHEEGHRVTTAEHGARALTLLAHSSELGIDVVLLDILMPELDGYATLEQIKQNPALRHIPVIMITAVEELDSVVRCLEMGAADYLPKPFNPALLRARINGSLAHKRLRDIELEYLEQVSSVTAAAVALEASTFDPASIAHVAARTDALGQLARVFRRMAGEVRAREERLKQQVQELRIEIDEARQAKKAAEIIESDYYQNLRSQAQSLRQIMDDVGDVRNVGT